MFLPRWAKPPGFPTSFQPVANWPADGVVAPETHRLEAESYSDFLSQAVAEGSYSANERRTPTKAEIEAASKIMEQGRPPGDLDKAIQQLLSFVRQYPQVERFQILIGRMLESHRDRRAPGVWQGIDFRFAKSSEAFRLVLRWAFRDFGQDRAQQLLNERYPEQPSEPVELIAYARACEELRNYSEADEAFARVEQLERVNLPHYLTIASAVRKRGEFHRALGVVERAETRFGTSARLQQLATEIRRDIDRIIIALPNVKFETRHVGKAILERVLSDLVTKRRDAPVDDRMFLGPAVMMNASLGCGGAERQFVTTALGLQSCISRGEQIAGVDLVGPVSVMCRSLQSRPGADFFLPDLEKGNIPVLQYAGFPEFGGNVRHSTARHLVDILRYLPQPTAESVRKVSDVLVLMRPDIVHIWQDGSILANCITALLAEVPRIVLSIRSVPPIDRPERNKIEYEAVFRSLLTAPGVRLVANSQMIARRYAEWLELDPHRVEVIYNGSDPLPSDSDLQARRQFEEFNSRTGDSVFTVGTVFRLDENKRPFLWVDAAADLLRQVPQARFICVGDGPLLQPTKDYAERLGVANRFLFTGRSAFVGYWLSKMDVFLLLSRFEGLPNVLIEAQFAGLPVVTTDAGGASETIIQGETGTVLSNVESPKAADIAAAVLAWRPNPVAQVRVATAATQWARASFSTQSMLQKTVQVYMS